MNHFLNQNMYKSLPTVPQAVGRVVRQGLRSVPDFHVECEKCGKFDAYDYHECREGDVLAHRELLKRRAMELSTLHLFKESATNDNGFGIMNIAYSAYKSYKDTLSEIEKSRALRKEAAKKQKKEVTRLNRKEARKREQEVMRQQRLRIEREFGR